MKVSRDLQVRARGTRYHERIALKRLGQGQLDRVGARTLGTLIEAGWVERLEEGSSPLALTATGQEIHDALKELGWFPP